MDSPQIYKYFFPSDSEFDGLHITWAHAVNSQNLLSESLNGTLHVFIISGWCVVLIIVWTLIGLNYFLITTIKLGGGNFKPQIKCTSILLI